MRRTTTLTALISLAGLTLGAGAITPALAAETCDGRAATIVVPATDAYPPPFVIGIDGDDVIVGSAGDDRIDGAGGNDTICGLGGGDRILGGAGNDRLFGGLDFYDYEDYDGDQIEPGPGDDHVDLGYDPVTEEISWANKQWDQVSFANAAGPVTVDLTAGTATGEGDDTIAPIVLIGGVEGSAFDDRLTGSEQIDWITAGGGDEIEGGFGVDTLRGGEGRDVLRVDDAERGTTADGRPGRDGLGSWVRTGKALLIGGGGADAFYPEIRSRADRAVIRGGSGKDRLSPGASLKAAPHRSLVIIDARSGRVTMKVGTRIRFSSITSFGFGGSTATRIHWWGSRRSEVLRFPAQDGPVCAFGGGGNDRITGGWGPDLLDGGPGRDVLNGDKGRDRCLRGERLKSCEARR